MIDASRIIDTNKMQNALKEVGFITEQAEVSGQKVVVVFETGEGVVQPTDSLNWEVISEHERLLFPSPGEVVKYFLKQYVTLTKLEGVKTKLSNQYGVKVMEIQKVKDKLCFLLIETNQFISYSPEGYMVLSDHATKLFISKQQLIDHVIKKD